ncbi:regulatory protein [Spirochaeta isovalerica]|uniref:Regulatory protein RecX n=1 Tax=Spirochaeta isovalerica TaxID=150 RepID=A0A841RFK8_9SPIO|nr:regulatory protein [Spirochaeta isovalerica]
MREESSSSQNVKLYIASITERGSSGEGFTVRLSDGSSFFVSSTFFERHGFAEGMVLEENEMDILEEEEQRVLALRKAGDLLSRAEQSSGGLFLKLKKKGFSDAVCRQAVDRVVELGLLDDERFATFWLESRLRQHPEGRNILYQGLLARGVAAESAKEALSRVVKEDVMLQAVLKAGSKLSRRYGSDEGKLRRALLRRGFSQGEIRYFFEHN